MGTLKCVWNWESHLEGNMNKEGHVEILKENLKQSGAKVGLDYRFSQRNDPKHTPLLVKKHHP